MSRMTTPFGFKTTAAEVVEGIDLTGKRVIVTGAASGIDPNKLLAHFKTKEQGAATSVLLAASPLLEGIGGCYFFDCSEAEIVTERTGDMSGVAPYALDAANAERLWEESLRLLAQTIRLNDSI